MNRSPRLSYDSDTKYLDEGLKASSLQPGKSTDSFKSIESSESFSSISSTDYKYRPSYPLHKTSTSFSQVHKPSEISDRKKSTNALKRLTGGWGSLTSIRSRLFSQIIDVQLKKQWSSSFHFYCVSGCSMIGAGNLINFPLLISEHGAVSILVTYALVLFFVGYPLLLVQMGIAQFTSKGPGGCWEFAIFFKGVGYTLVFFIFLFAGFFMIPQMEAMVKSYKYLTDDYIISESYQLLMKPEVGNATDKSFDNDLGGHGVLKDDIFIYMFLINWVLVTLHVLPETPMRGNISSSMFVAFITTIVVFTIRSMTLSGALKGIKFAFRDNRLDIMNLDIWRASFTQCFFSLSLTPCYQMTTASFNHFNNLIPFDTLVCILLDTCVSIVGIFFTFSLLGHLSETTDFNLEELSEISGDAIKWELLPKAIENQISGTIWIYAYFCIWTVMYHLQATTCFAIAFTGLIDVFRFHLRHRVISLASSIILFVTSFWVCLNSRDIIYGGIMDYDRIISPLQNLFLLFPTMWVFGVDNILALFECSVGWDTTYILSGKWWKIWWHLNWKYVLPSILIIDVIYAIYHEVTMFQSEEEIFRPEQLALEICIWGITALLVVSPMVFLMITTKQGGLKDRFLYLIKPSEKWGPQLSHHRHMMKIGEEDRLRARQKPPKKDNIASTFEELSLIMENR